MSRILFTLKMAWRYRKKLRHIKRDHTWHAKTLLQVNCHDLQARGCQVLVLDFDGVMASHGMVEPLHVVLLWLQHAIKIYGADHIYILSNKPQPLREDFFYRLDPKIHFISGVRKKPYPDGLEKIIHRAKVKPLHVVLIDDRLLTGVLAAQLVGCQAVWIREPYRHFMNRFWAESFFTVLRWTECLIIF